MNQSAVPEPVRWARVLAEKVAAELGDCCVVTLADDDRASVTVVAAHHRDAALQATADLVLGVRYPRGDGMPWRVFDKETGIHIPHLDQTAFRKIAQPPAAEFSRRIGVSSLMLVPLRRDRRLVGTLGITRDGGRPEYTESEYVQFERRGRGAD